MNIFTFIEHTGDNELKISSLTAPLFISVVVKVMTHSSWSEWCGFHNVSWSTEVTKACQSVLHAWWTVWNDKSYIFEQLSVKRGEGRNWHGLNIFIMFKFSACQVYVKTQSVALHIGFYRFIITERVAFYKTTKPSFAKAWLSCGMV